MKKMNNLETKDFVLGFLLFITFDSSLLSNAKAVKATEISIAQASRPAINAFIVYSLQHDP